MGDHVAQIHLTEITFVRTDGFSPGPTHTAEMMDELTNALVEIFGREELREAA